MTGRPALLAALALATAQSVIGASLLGTELHPDRWPLADHVIGSALGLVCLATSAAMFWLIARLDLVERIAG